MSDSDNNQDRERFGRYLILDHLVDGGMAKICRARFLGEQADKIVAIKMVRPQYSQDESFKTMFMDEIKLTFGLIHPNIIQTYDYGIHKEQLFVAMEYCDGRNLKEYLDKLRERKFVFPVEISSYIITQVCQGLHYAHTFTDKLTGKESSIIHRDISPHNIMLTYDGAVKVIDFGIAKSDTNSESTQAGTIKGKLSYLAPEYLEGHELDPRYDEFAVGITLWEMLCSRKLFKANNDLAVLKKIQDCKVPAPSSINPNVPKELDEIVLKALSKDRNKRYDDLDQLNRALMKFLYTHYPDFNSTDLSYFAKELFKDEIKLDREKLFEFGKIDLRPYLDDLKNEQNGGSPKSNKGSGVESTQIKAREREQVIDFGFEEEESKSETIKVSKMRGGDKSAPAKAKSADSPEPVKPNLEELFGEKEEPTLSIDASTRPVKETRSVDQQMTMTKSSDRGTRGSTKVRMKRTGSVTGTSVRKIRKSKSTSEPANKMASIVAAGILLAAGYLYMQYGDTAKQLLGLGTMGSSVAVNEVHEEVSNTRENRRPAARDEVGSFRLQNFDQYRQRIYIDGREVKPDVIGVVSAPMGRDLVIRVQQSGRRHFVKTIRIEKDSDLVLDIPNMPQAAYGYLETSRVCIRGEIHFEIFGERRKEIVPIPQRGRIAFPVVRGDESTVHDVYFQRAGEDIQRKFTLQFREGRTTDLCDQIN